MKAQFAKRLVVFLSLACLFVMLVAWEGMKKAAVQSQALSCYEMGEVLICVDGQVYEQMNCERLDANTIFCSQASGRPL